jgi:serine/threonine protein kinase
MASLIGQKLGKYEIHGRLGRGGMAEVYKAYQPGLDRFVAIKIIGGYFADVPEFVARFKREARSIAQLRHAHIVQVFDFDIEDEIYYMVMEYIQGGTLHQRIQQHGALPVQDALRIGLSLADALSYAHQRGMIHRDIKPANVMFATDGSEHPVLTDFGIARILGETALTTSGVVGTPAYISPEVGRGEPVDERTDIYSMGVMLYEMVTGRLPYYGDTPYAIIMKHVHDPLPSLRQFTPDVPEAAEEVIYKALAKRCDLRYQTAGDLRDALQAALNTPYQPSPLASAIQRGAAAMYAAANLTPVLEANTRILPPETEEGVEPPVAGDTPVLTEEADESPRRKPVLLILILLGALLAVGFIILRGDGAPGALIETATDTAPVLVVTEELPSLTPTLTLTTTPTLPPTDSLTDAPTAAPTVTVTRKFGHASLPMPGESVTTRTPPPPTNTPLPPAPRGNSSQDNGGDQPSQDGGSDQQTSGSGNGGSGGPQSSGGGSGEQPPPDDGGGNIVSDTVDEVEDTVDEVVDDVGDVVDGLLGGD